MLENHNFTVCIVNYYTSNIISNILTPLNEFQKNNKVELDVHIQNNSKDDDLEAAIKEFPNINIKLFTSDKNLGYPSAICSLHSQVKKYDYAFFINPDCLFTSCQLEQFVSKLKNKSFGAAVCNITNGLSGPEYTGIATVKENNKMSYEIDAYGWKFAMGAFVLYNLKALDSVGSFDNQYFMYWEDSDISVRLQLDGYKIISSKLDNPVKHSVGYCSNSFLKKIKSRYYFYKGLYRFRKKFNKETIINNVEYI